MCARLLALFLQRFDIGDAAARVGVATIHEAVNKRMVGNAVFARNIYELKEVIERGVNATRRGQTHDMELLAGFFSATVRGYNLGVLHDGVVANSDIDFYQILINHSSGTDIQMPYLRVSHLSVRQTYVLAAGLKLRVGIVFQECIPVGSRGAVDGILFACFAQAPAIKNHK